MRTQETTEDGRVVPLLLPVLVLHKKKLGGRARVLIAIFVISHVTRGLWKVFFFQSARAEKGKKVGRVAIPATDIR